MLVGTKLCAGDAAQKLCAGCWSCLARLAFRPPVVFCKNATRTRGSASRVTAAADLEPPKGLESGLGLQYSRYGVELV